MVNNVAFRFESWYFWKELFSEKVEDCENIHTCLLSTKYCQYKVQILDRMIQNFKKNLEKMFTRYYYVIYSNLQPHRERVNCKRIYRNYAKNDTPLNTGNCYNDVHTTYHCY